MAKVNVSEDISVDPQTAWEKASDLARFDQWLKLHDGWRGELPAELAEGEQITSVISVKGMRNRIEWTITEYSPPEYVQLSGTGKGGTKVSLRLSVKPKGAGSTFAMDVDFSNPALFGPLGSGVARALKGDVKKSIEAFAALD